MKSMESLVDIQKWLLICSQELFTSVQCNLSLMIGLPSVLSVKCQNSNTWKHFNLRTLKASLLHQFSEKELLTLAGRAIAAYILLVTRILLCNMTIKVVLLPMFFVSMLCGTMPLKLVSSFPFKLKGSSVSLAYTIFLSTMSIWNSITTFSVVMQIRKPSAFATTTRAPDTICNCTSTVTQSTEAQYLIMQVFNPHILIIMSLGAHWVSIFRIKPHLPLFVDYLISIDSKLPFLVKGLSLSKTYYSLAVRFIAILAVSFVVFGFYITFHVSRNFIQFLWIVSLVFHNFVSLTCELQLLIFILMIKTRFQLVNDALSSMCHHTMTLHKSVKSRKILYPNTENSSDLQRIELAHDCYLKLVDAWILLNNIYAVQVLFSTSGCFLKSLFNVYFLSSFCIEKQGAPHTDTINSAMWMVFYFSRFTILALEATSASKESCRTKAITALMSHWYDDTSIKEELDIFWINASNRNLTFSTCGLFTLNSGLIIKACLTGITYLVLLVQFKPQIGVY